MTSQIERLADTFLRNQNNDPGDAVLVKATVIIEKAERAIGERVNAEDVEELIDVAGGISKTWVRDLILDARDKDVAEDPYFYLALARAAHTLFEGESD